MEAKKFYDLLEFSNVRRSLAIDGRMLFCVGDILKLLGYKSIHPFIFKRSTPSSFIMKEATGVYMTDEEGVVNFIRRSSLPQAKLFREQLGLGERIVSSNGKTKGCPICKRVSLSLEKIKEHVPCYCTKTPRKILLCGLGIFSAGIILSVKCHKRITEGKK